MSLDLCILASGSSGNATVIRAPSGAMLIDAGIGPRTTAKRLNGTGAKVSDIRCICLTHLDSDHFTHTWVDTIVRNGIRVFCFRDRHSALMERIARGKMSLKFLRDFAELLEPFDFGDFSPLDGINMHPISLAHDETGSHGFLIEGFETRIGYATDLGHVPARLLEKFCDVDLLAIESNYDEQMQLESARPVYLKRRIMGGRGHLSNDQALQAVRRLLDRCQKSRRKLPSHIVLLHRSRECNCPNLLTKLFSQDTRIAPRLVLGEPFVRTEWLRAKAPVEPYVGEQLTFVA